MKKLLGKLIFGLMGWKLDNSLDTSKTHSCVLVCGPHTSNWDFVVTVSAFWIMDIPIKMLIKDDWTKPWYGFFIKKLGGIGVDRSQRQNLTEHVAALLRNKSERLYIINTPEGTRSYSEKWKRGFYHIARLGEVPILFAFADYKKKIAGISGYIDPKDKSIEDVLSYAQEFYKDINPKFPEKFNKNIK